MRTTARGAVVGAAAAVVLAAGGVAAGLPIAYGDGSARPCAEADARVQAPFDLMFATHMIPHHESAVAMAQVALDRSQSEEVRTLSAGIIATQSAEISLLGQAADRLGESSSDGWGGRPGPGTTDPTGRGSRTSQRGGGPDVGDHWMGGGDWGGARGDMGGMGEMGGMGGGTDPGTLAAVPPEQFDRAYLRAMIEHHRIGVHMAQMEALRGSDTEVVTLAEEMVTAQTAEMRLMQTWLEKDRDA